MKRLIHCLDLAWIWFARTVLVILTVLLYRPRVYRTSANVPRGRMPGAHVLTCNHLRGCDGAVISALYPLDRIHSIAAMYWYRKWYLRPLLHCGYSIPIERTSTAWVKASREALEAGDSVLIFPEGMAVPGPDIRPFKPGFLLLARAAEVPILPIYMEGAYNRPFLKRLRIVIGEPYLPEPPADGMGMSRTYCDEQCRILYEKTVALRDFLAERRGKKHARKEREAI